MAKSLISSFLVECLASFAVVFYATNQIKENHEALVINNGLSLFFIVMPMAWFSYKISGGHLNPLVSLAALIAGKSKLSVSLINMLGQISGGFLGFIILRLVEPPAATSFYDKSGLFDLICMESAIVFCICIVYLVTANNRKISRAVYGFVVPGIYCAGALAFGLLFSARFNPAWYLPVYLIEGGFVSTLFIQVSSGAVTSVVAALFYRFVLDNTKVKGMERHLLENQDTNTINF